MSLKFWSIFAHDVVDCDLTEHLCCFWLTLMKRCDQKSAWLACAAPYPTTATQVPFFQEPFWDMSFRDGRFQVQNPSVQCNLRTPQIENLSQLGTSSTQVLSSLRHPNLSKPFEFHQSTAFFPHLNIFLS